FNDKDFINKIDKQILLISLYGLKSIAELEREILLNIFQIVNPKLKNVATIGKNLISASLKISNLISGANIKSSFGDIFKNIEIDVEELEYSKYIFIFDDLERATINIDEFFGFVSNYVENLNLKTILVSNENELRKLFKERDDFEIKAVESESSDEKIVTLNNSKTNRYDTIKEKIIYKTVEFESDIDLIFDKFILNFSLVENDKDNRFNFDIKNIKNDIMPILYKDRNLRSLKYFLHISKTVFKKIDFNSEEYTDKEIFNKTLEKLFYSIFIFSIAYKNGVDLSEFLEKGSIKDRFKKAVFNVMNNITTTKADFETFKERYGINQYGYSFEYNRMIVSFIYFYNLDSIELNSILKKQYLDLFGKKQKSDVYDSYDLIIENRFLELDESDFDNYLLNLKDNLVNGKYSAPYYYSDLLNLVNQNSFLKRYISNESIEIGFKKFIDNFDNLISIHELNLFSNETLNIIKEHNKKIENRLKYKQKKRLHQFFTESNFDKKHGEINSEDFDWIDYDLHDFFDVLKSATNRKLNWFNRYLQNRYSILDLDRYISHKDKIDRVLNLIDDVFLRTLEINRHFIKHENFKNIKQTLKSISKKLSEIK
ncbi:hypothetical protein JXR93_03765, partial [bacterium]|nr:hypothetical protein [bacterium]